MLPEVVEESSSEWEWSQQAGWQLGMAVRVYGALEAAVAARINSRSTIQLVTQSSG